MIGSIKQIVEQNCRVADICWGIIYCIILYASWTLITENINTFTENLNEYAYIIEYFTTADDQGFGFGFVFALQLGTRSKYRSFQHTVEVLMN